MRVVAGSAFIGQGIVRLRICLPIGPAILEILAITGGILLLIGLWTPISGSLVGLLELCNTFSQSGDPLAKILLGTLGVALALLGPGAWSVDARLFGWKRIDIRNRKH
jgi:uncharacterized membrane protein YphA (DoxX/SURF4 family)